MKYSLVNYKNFYKFSALSRFGLLNKQKSNVLSFYFVGSRANISLLNLDLFFYNHRYLQLFFKHLLRQHTNGGKIVICCIDKDIFFIVNAIANKFKLRNVSIYLWTGGLITNPVITFKSNSILFSSLSKKKSRTIKTNKNIQLIVSAGYSKNLITEAKRRNLPIIGLLEPENSFGTDYLLFGDAATNTQVYLNFTLLFHFLKSDAK